MSREERTGFRSDAYSRWHRALPDAPTGDGSQRQLGFIDIDWIEWCDVCHQPLALLETCYDNGRPKTATVVRNLGDRSDLPVFVVQYQTDHGGAITQFRVRRERPKPTPYYTLTPAEWAQRVMAMRTCHPWPTEEFDAIMARVPYPRPAA